MSGGNLTLTQKSRALVEGTSLQTAGYTLLGILLAYVTLAFRVWEFFSFLHSVWQLACATCRWCGGRSRGRTTAEQRWAELVNGDRFLLQQQRARRDAAVSCQWSKRAAVSRALRNPTIGAAWTWQQWNVFGGCLRTHLWHLDRKSRR